MLERSRVLLCVLGSVAAACLAQAQGVRRPSTASASVSLVADSMHMTPLDRQRRVAIYLPPDYATSTRRYPVVYLQDGQNVFDGARAFAGEWGVDETLDSLHARTGLGVIVVAIDNDGRHRMDEYDPWRSADTRLGGGEGRAYLDFIAQTLKPLIDARYRTRPEAAQTMLAGSSMGGLIALAGALERPTVFGRAAIFSAATWVARDSMLALARRAGRAKDRARLWFVVGGEETADDEPLHDQRAVVAALVASGYVAGRDVVAIERPDGRHQEWFWRGEFPHAILWFTRAAHRPRAGMTHPHRAP
ncbi:MAG: alpha/beta hydrolase-fold protein [Gemmatimonadaceae bacterium]|nr:alpha/beta hydrolase-fold protein [Gemmatimonadaceae bacterium]